MRGPTHAKRRDNNERALRADLDSLGVANWQMDQPVDLLCWSGRHKKLFLVEIKNPEKRGKDKRTELQKKFFATCEALELPIFLIETRADIVAALATFKTQEKP